MLPATELPMTFFYRSLPVFLTVFSCASPGGTGNAVADRLPGEPEYAWVVFGSDSVRAEVARTEAERERGLMFRETIPEDGGMLFVFARPEIQGVWMRDTYLALDAAFLDEDARVIGIEPLEPEDSTVTYSPGPVLFVLEVPRGWLASHGVEVGDTAVIVFGAAEGRQGGGGSGCERLLPEKQHEPYRDLVRAGSAACSAVNSSPPGIAGSTVLDQPRYRRSTRHEASRTGVRAGLTASVATRRHFVHQTKGL